ncbi:unnamed protein product [Cercospora beticola]|nr:unnamed protein product [Cercospora beticola]
MSRSRSAEHDARNSALKTALGTTELARAASQPTATTVPSRCNEIGLSWEVQDLADSHGARIYWLGARTAPTVLLYFHGGGFGLGAFPGHIDFLDSCIKKTGNELVVALLEYGLSPTHRYPVQYNQASKALIQVMTSGYEPSSILIGGDSCGGNMALAILSSFSHSTPLIQKLELKTPLKGALLICPWVTFSPDWESCRSSADQDITSVSVNLDWANEYISSDDHNNYSEPVRAEVSWWKGLAVDDILVLWGENELSRNPVQKLSTALSDAGLNVTARECAKQVHIDCVLDAQTGMSHGEMTEHSWEWLKQKSKWNSAGWSFQQKLHRLAMAASTAMMENESDSLSMGEEERIADQALFQALPDSW